ncbi:MAG: hypothetical protein QXG39_08950 [Candidatus Aenigmatarchaeota archaeon]
MSFEELENLFKKVKTCPSCGSKEGFWLVAQLYKKSLQCKNCGAIIEVFETTRLGDENGDRKQILKRK